MLANASDVSKCKVNFFPIINVQILKKNEEKQEKNISTLSKQEKKETRLIMGRASIYSKKTYFTEKSKTCKSLSSEELPYII